MRSIRRQRLTVSRRSSFALTIFEFYRGRTSVAAFNTKKIRATHARRLCSAGAKVIDFGRRFTFIGGKEILNRDRVMTSIKEFPIPLSERFAIGMHATARISLPSALMSVAR